MGAIVPRPSARSVESPALLQRAGKNASIAAAEFVSARLSNPHTSYAYACPVANLLALVRTARDRATPGTGH